MLKLLRRRVAKGGALWIVIGDSRYGGVHIPTATIVGELAVAASLRVKATGWAAFGSTPEDVCDLEFA